MNRITTTITTTASIGASSAPGIRVDVEPGGVRRRPAPESGRRRPGHARRYAWSMTRRTVQLRASGADTVRVRSRADHTAGSVRAPVVPTHRARDRGRLDRYDRPGLTAESGYLISGL